MTPVAHHRIPAGFGLRTCIDAPRCVAQANQQLGGGAPPGVAVLGENAAMRFSPKDLAEPGVG